MAGSSAMPFWVSRYWTRGGLPSSTRRSTIPSASSSFSRSDNSRSDRSGTHSLISEKRAGPSSSTATIAPVQRLPTSSIAWWYSEQHAALCGGAITSPIAGIVDPLGGVQQPRVLGRAVRRDVPRPSDEVREAGQRHMRDGLEDLVVAPTRL